MLGQLTGTRWQGGVVSKGADTVAVETTRELYLDDVLVTRSVVSPADLREWGAGHIISEHLLPEAEIARVEQDGERVRVRSRNGSGTGPPEMVRRSSDYLGRLGNGELAPVDSEDFRVSAAQIEAYSRALSELAPGWRSTGGLHVALLYDERGRLVSAAEDVGRHNAVDKVIGAAHLMGIDRRRCTIVISGRMPEGMVSKVIRARIPVAVTKAASTDRGVETARRCRLTLVCFARPGRFTIYSGDERVLS